MSEATLIASLTTPPSTSGVELSALPECVNGLEVRSDLLGDLNPGWLRQHFKGRLVYSLRSRAEGGNSSESLDQRHDRLAQAAHSYDLVELEGDRDLTAEVLAAVPVDKRLISWHGPATRLDGLKAKFDQLSSVPASNYKLVSTARQTSDELTPLCLLKSLNRSDTVAFSVGLLGFWSRLVALHLGAPAIFGMVPNGHVIPMEPTINKLVEDYGLPALGSTKAIYGIAGNPVSQSLSPQLHNAAYRALKHPALFVPFHVESFSEFWNDIVRSGVLDSLGLPLNGITVVSPHKEAALLTTEMVSPMARQAESANILVRNNGWWKADTTDPEVVSIASNGRSIQMKHKRIAVIGCGGAGRAIAAALNQSGAGVTLVNRGSERGTHAASLLRLPYRPLLGFNAQGYDILVNATPVGRDDDEVPFRVEDLDQEAVIIDLAYGSRPTPLVANSLARERVTIDGREILLGQVQRQFQLMTGKEMPVRLMRQSLGLKS
jgi:3-dehydroquinate dehydratase / shikimate dehydrogenase